MFHEAFAYFKEKPFLLLLLIVLALFALWSCVKAGKASAKHRREQEAILKKIDADTALMRKFSNLTPALAQDADNEELFKGVALGLCRTIEKSADIEKAFGIFTEEQKQIYSLYFVFEDGSKKLNEFFKINGKPLTVYAKKAFDSLYSGEWVQAFDREYLAYDEDDETTSLIPENIEKDNLIFARFLESGNAFSAPAAFIRENINAFLCTAKQA